MINYFMSLSLIAQLVEHSAVNRVVTGSSPVRGAMERYPRGRRGRFAKALGCYSREGSNPSLSV
jgi:hypothetical protein